MAVSTSGNPYEKLARNLNVDGKTFKYYSLPDLDEKVGKFG
jgi:hypothetical protein